MNNPQRERLGEGKQKVSNHAQCTSDPLPCKQKPINEEPRHRHKDHLTNLNHSDLCVRRVRNHKRPQEHCNGKTTRLGERSHQVRRSSDI